MQKLTQELRSAVSRNKLHTFCAYFIIEKLWIAALLFSTIVEMFIKPRHDWVSKAARARRRELSMEKAQMFVDGQTSARVRGGVHRLARRLATRRDRPAMK